MNNFELTKTLTRLDRNHYQHQQLQFKCDHTGNVCPRCQELDGKIFAADSADCPELPLHPNCRCKLVPINLNSK